jgi:hypothetical protein
MSKPNVLGTLINALDDLPDEELKQLERLLLHPNIAETLRRLVAHTRQLRKGDSDLTFATQGTSERPTKSKRPVPAVSADATSSRPVRSKSKRDVYSIIDVVLSDKIIFPTTKDAVEAVNTEFKLGLDPVSFTRRGRRDLVQRVCTMVKQMPDQGRQAALSSFAERISGSSSQGREYRELFKMLTR